MKDFAVTTADLVTNLSGMGIPAAVCVVVGLSLGAVIIWKAIDNGYTAEAEISEERVRIKFGK